MKTTRDEVYHAIDTERDYQDSLWTSETTSSGGLHSIEEWLVYMEDYINEAKHILSRRARQESDPIARNIIRKIAAMSVACMEQNGCTIRERPDPRRIMEDHGVSINS